MAQTKEESPRKLARRKDDVLVREDLMDITILLDRSGSMAGEVNDVIEGFNKLLRDQQEMPDGEARMTLQQFDDRFQTDYEAKPVKECQFLAKGDYIPRGATHLFDSVARAVAMIDERLKNCKDDERPGKVVLTIFTDGGENNPHPEITVAQFQELLKSRREQQAWTIALVGCDESTLRSTGSMGLVQGNAVAFNKSNRGTKAAMARVSKGVSNLRGMSYNAYAGPSGPPGPEGPTGPAGYENFANLSALTPEEDAQARSPADWQAPKTT